MRLYWGYCFFCNIWHIQWSWIKNPQSTVYEPLLIYWCYGFCFWKQKQQKLTLSKDRLEYLSYFERERMWNYHAPVTASYSDIISARQVRSNVINAGRIEWRINLQGTDHIWKEAFINTLPFSVCSHCARCFILINPTCSYLKWTIWTCSLKYFASWLTV